MVGDGDGDGDGGAAASPWLWVEIVGARNLESRQAVDAYCVLRVGAQGGLMEDQQSEGDGGDVDAEEAPSGDAQTALWRSATAPSTSDPQWRFRAVTQLDGACASAESTGDAAAPDDALLTVEIFNEKNFFFDMFPSTGGSRRGDEAVYRCQGSSRSGSLSDEEEASPSLRNRRRRRPAKSVTDERPTQFDFNATDEALGVADLSLTLLQRRAARGASATDEWYLLRGSRSGEVRIRTLLLPTRPSEADTNAVWDELLYDSCAPMEDHYGFRIPASSVREWAHLRSYQACREQRRVAEWEGTFGSHFFSLTSARDSNLVKKLAREGVPRHWRQRVYMAMSGALEKQQNAPSKDYYASLVRQIDSRDSTSFRQIELDIDRTFGQSGTKMSTEEGRAMLRRVLKAYSMHNPTVGYCQGLNFIVGFLVLLLDEESTFWLLVVICEDMFPGYYIPTMTDTQTDMLVLKQLIAEELPELSEFTSDVGLPLELLGSQWLLCLFTTTFPSETVFRIFDCMMTEGAHFVFAVIMTHLRRLESKLLGVDEFQAVLSTMKEAENALLDADEFIREAVEEAEQITAERVARLREEHSVSVQDEMQRADRARALNRQLAVVYQIPAFSSTAANLLRFFHEEAEMSSRSDVAFVLTLLCHGLVWLAEHSKRLRR